MKNTTTALLRTFILFVSSIILPIIGLELASAAELGELQVTSVPNDGRGAFVVRDPQSVVLIVQTTITPLSFECNMGIIRVDNPAAGEYRLHLFAGTNLVTFKADGYLPLKERFFLEAKSAMTVRVVPLRKGITDEERPEIRLIYQPKPNESRIRGTLDTRILNLDFGSGSVILRPEPGEHSIKLVKGGNIWEKAYQLKASDKSSDTVIFTESAIVEPPSDQTGGLYITSSIPSIRVFLNDLYQGLTPLTLDSVPSGKYEMRLERSLFQPQSMEITVRPLDYSAYEVRLVPNFGLIKIDSDPQGAMVQIDGAERGITPLDQQRLDAGTYRVHLIRSHFADFDSTIKVAPGDTLDLRLAMLPRFGKLEVTSEPVGASVVIDGRNLGVTPLTCDTVLSGTHLVTLSTPFYSETDDQVKVSDGEAVSRNYKLTPNFGTVTIEGTPAGASLSLEGEADLKTTIPFVSQRLVPGIYRVSIEQEGYEPLHDVMVVELNRADTLAVALKRLSGTLKVSSSPQGAVIWLDNEEVGRTPTFLHDVPTGQRVLRLDKSGYDLYEDTLYIRNMELTSIDWALSAEGTKNWQSRRIGNTVRSVFIPGFGQFHADKPVRGVFWLVAFTGSLIYALDLRDQHAAKQDEYSMDRKAYLDAQNPVSVTAAFAKAQNSYDEMQDLSDKWKICIGATAGIYLLQLADTWLFSAGDRPHTQVHTLELGVTPDRHGAMISINLPIANHGGQR